MSSYQLVPMSSLVSVARSASQTGKAAGVTISQRTGVGLCSVVARKGAEREVALRVGQSFGIELPRSPRYIAAASNAVCWAGPSQWLFMREDVDTESLVPHLRLVLAGVASVMDQSGGRTIVRITGQRARDALAKGVGIDLHPSVFGPGDVAITEVSHLGVHFWQIDETPSYDFAMFRSFAVSFWEWIVDAADEFGVATL